MPTRTSQLIEAKYKNIPFKIRKETLNSIGQKRIQHDFPNTSVRYSEPQGVAPFDATIDIFFAGNNWIQDFQAFKRALEDPSPGRLYMPTFGIFNNIVAEPSNAESNQTSVGEISISIRFYETFDKPSPTITTTTVEDVFQKGQEAREELQAQVAESYKEPTSLNNLITVENDYNKIAEKVKDITGEENAFKTFIRNINKYIKDPEGIARLLLNNESPLGFLQIISNSLEGTQAYSQYKQIATIGNTLSNTMNDIRSGIISKASTVTEQIFEGIGIDSDINIWNDDTLERQQRNNNRYNVVNAFRCFGIIGMYEQAANTVYNTTDQIDKVTTELESYYSQIIQDDKSNIVIPKIKGVLDQIKGLAEDVLKNERQKAYKVTEIFLEKLYSAKTLCYELYGELIKNESQLNYLANLIKGLNKSIPASKLEGTVKVVEIG